MANSIIQLPVDSTGKKLDTEELVVGANTVHRERHQIAGDSDTDIAPVTAADGLLVNLGANNDVVDTAAEASLAVIDDWDESDRAKVNPIVGQAGVQGGSGVITALTQRVVLATDQPTVPVSLAAGGTTQYAEDTAHSSGDQVTLAGVVQQSADAALSSDGDRSVLQVDASGFAKVNVKASALPSGASTLAEQQTQTSHLAAIETAVEILDNAIAGSEMQVDVVSSALPTGASTLAEQQTQTTHLAAIETAVEIIDNAIAGSEMQVDIVAALPAGTNNIGDVDVLSSALPTGASTLAEQQSQTTHLATIAGDTTAIETAIQIIDDWDETDRAKVNIIAGQVGVAAGAGASSALTQRVVQANDGGKTILSAGGSAAGSGNNTLVAAGTNKLKVLAFSLTTTSTTAMTCIFQSGAGGTELWRVIIQAPTGVSAGANLSIALPAYLFATAAATLLNLNLSSANAVHWSVTYIDEA